jgi:hypothetical protein
MNALEHHSFNNLEDYDTNDVLNALDEEWTTNLAGFRYSHSDLHGLTSKEIILSLARSTINLSCDLVRMGRELEECRKMQLHKDCDENHCFCGDVENCNV